MFAHVFSTAFKFETRTQVTGMRRPRKKRSPVTTDSSVNAGSSNPRSGRRLIRQFHVLLKRRAALLGASTAAASDDQSLAETERKIESLGGLSAYQRMSTIGQARDRGGGSEKKLMAWLRDMGFADRTHRPTRLVPKLRLLEVGALKPDNYRSCSSWIDVTSIDLRSQHPGIREQDFLLMDLDENRGRWDVVSLSLVLNFVPEVRDRGRMLRLAHGMLAKSGFLFLVLPLPCVENSRYLTFDHLETLIRAVGFTQVLVEWRKGGKMAYWLYQKTETDSESDAPAVSVEPFQKKVVLKQGGHRNNFCILL